MRRDLFRPGAQRSLLLAGAGAIVGLIIAGFGLFTAHGTRTSIVPAEDAAIVNQVPILMSDLIAQLRAADDVSLSDATHAQKTQVLDGMIREELYVQRGVELGLAKDDIDVRTALVTATEAQTASDATTVLPTNDEQRRWYADHRSRYASEGVMNLHDFLAPKAHGDGQDLVAALRSGASPTSLGLRSSGHVDDGDEFYYAARLHLGEALFARARVLATGAVSTPIPQSDAVHILVMVRNAPPVPDRFEDASSRVLADFQRDKVARLEKGNDRFLRKRADIIVAPALR